MRLLRAGDADVPTHEHQLALGLAGSSRRCGPRDQAARQRWRQSLGTRAAAGLAIQYATCFASGEARATKTTASIDWKPAMGSGAGGGGGNRERHFFFCNVNVKLLFTSLCPLTSDNQPEREKRRYTLVRQPRCTWESMGMINPNQTQKWGLLFRQLRFRA